MPKEPFRETDDSTESDSAPDPAASDDGADQPPIEVKRTPRLRSGKYEDSDSTD